MLASDGIWSGCENYIPSFLSINDDIAVYIEEQMKTANARTQDNSTLLLCSRKLNIMSNSN